MRDLHALILAILPVGRTKTSRWAIAAITLGLLSTYGLSTEPAHAQSIPVLPPVTPENVDTDDLLQNEVEEAGDTILEERDPSSELDPPSESDSDVEPVSGEVAPELGDEPVDVEDSSSPDTEIDNDAGDDSPNTDTPGDASIDTEDASSDIEPPSDASIDAPSEPDTETVILDSEEGDRPDADDLLLDEEAVTPAGPETEQLPTDAMPDIPLDADISDIEEGVESELEPGLEPELNPESDLNPDIFELEIELDDPDVVPETAPPIAPPVNPSTSPSPPNSFKPSRGTTIFENVVLAPNAMANPTTIRGISGGPLTASRVAGRTDTATGICTGFVDRQPDHRIELTEFFDYLSLQVESPEDTVLVVRGPGGSWCNDDVLGFNPGLAGEWFSGTYDVWVGSYNEETYHPYIIRLTDTQ